MTFCNIFSPIQSNNNNDNDNRSRERTGWEMTDLAAALNPTDTMNNNPAIAMLHSI